MQKNCSGGGKEGRARREGAGEGERKDREGWMESRSRGKVKQAWNRRLKTEGTGNNKLPQKMRCEKE